MRQSRIITPDEPEALQLNLFEFPDIKAPAQLNPYPEAILTPAGLEQVRSRARNAIGLDFEFNTKTHKPSVIGVATRDLIASAPYTPEFLGKLYQTVVQNGLKLVGHSVIGADRPVLEQALGVKTPLKMWRDSMLTHYLENQDFTKGTSKDEDDDDSGSLGFMNLFTAVSMTTGAYQYKICRGLACDGPCPRHNVFGYCGVDAWGGLEADTVNRERLLARGMTEAFIDEFHELAEICQEMQDIGVRIDLPYAQKLEKSMAEERDKLFEFEISKKVEDWKRKALEALDDKEAVKKYLTAAEKAEIKDRRYKEFNPRSTDQVLEWFSAKGVELKSNEKESIKDTLNQVGMRTGFVHFDKYIDHLEESPPQESGLNALFRLFKYKTAGKGPDAWFNEKYLKNTNEIHARFIPTGSSMARLSSASPNFQNIPVRGWGKKLKKAVLPIDPDHDFVEGDFSQLELRGVLYQAGVSLDVPDAFNWLVEQGDGLFEKYLALTAFESARDLAKSISHAADYLEGFQVYYPADLMRPKTIREIKAGAIRIYWKKYNPDITEDWEYGGGIVGFSGGNLAKRFFGDASVENRAKALAIQEDLYFKKFPVIRQWHRKILAESESQGFVRFESGRFLRLYGSPRDNAKMTAAAKGQGFGADHVQAIMIKLKREYGRVAAMQVHDSLLFGVPKGWSDKKVAEFMVPMFEESGIRFPGFKAPGSLKNVGGCLRGANYGELRKLVL